MATLPRGCFRSFLCFCVRHFYNILILFIYVFVRMPSCETLRYCTACWNRTCALIHCFVMTSHESPGSVLKNKMQFSYSFNWLQFPTIPVSSAHDNITWWTMLMRLTYSPNNLRQRAHAGPVAIWTYFQIFEIESVQKSAEKRKEIKKMLLKNGPLAIKISLCGHLSQIPCAQVRSQHWFSMHSQSGIVTPLKVYWYTPDMLVKVHYIKAKMAAATSSKSRCGLPQIPYVRLPVQLAISYNIDPKICLFLQYLTQSPVVEVLEFCMCKSPMRTRLNLIPNLYDSENSHTKKTAILEKGLTLEIKLGPFFFRAYMCLKYSEAKDPQVMILYQCTQSLKLMGLKSLFYIFGFPLRKNQKKSYLRQATIDWGDAHPMTLYSSWVYVL